MRDAANPEDDSGSDVFGDFEDIETGREFGGDGDAATATALKAIQDEARARQDDKAAKKTAFDSEYDVGECFFMEKSRLLNSVNQSCEIYHMELLCPLIVYNQEDRGFTLCQSSI